MMDGLFLSFGHVSVCFFVFLVSGVVTLVFILKERRKNSELLNDIFETSEHGRVLFNSKGVFFKANAVACQALSSVIENDFKGMTQQAFLDCLYDYATDFDESIRNTILEGRAREQTRSFMEVISAGDDALWLVVGQPLNDHYTLFTLTDIDAGRRREENLIKLDKVNRHLYQAIQAAMSGIVISDPKAEGNPILFANKAFYSFVECDPEDVHKQSWEVLMPFFDDEAEKAKFVNALADFNAVDLSLQKRCAHDAKYYSLRLTPVLDQHGGLDLYVGIMVDLTLLKQRESEFFHAQKLDSLGQLAAGVAHDFNNVLSIINGYSTMISRQLGEGASQKNLLGYADKISSAADRGAALTRKMLTFSRHKVVAPEVIDLYEVTKEQSELIQPLLAGGIDLKLSLLDESVNVRGNVGSFSQILMNLAINAKDAMPGGGVLEVSVTVPDYSCVPEKIRRKFSTQDFVCVEVRDTGTGMNDETLAKVFDPFFSTKEQGKGTGLGLSVVYGLVNEMNGALDVVSVVGEGTSFFVYLPRCFEEKTKSLEGNIDDVASIKLDGYVGVVVDDEPDLLLIVTQMLEDAGMKVLSASDGNEALGFLDDYEGNVDLVLTDVVMPGMNGVKLAELVEALQPGIKVVFMSGYPANGDMAPVTLPQGVPFVAKPVNYDALVRVLFQVLKNSESVSSQWQTVEEDVDVSEIVKGG